MTPFQLNQCDILFRIATRGARVVAQRQAKFPEEGRYADIFHQLLDEIVHLKNSNRAQDEGRAREETYA